MIYCSAADIENGTGYSARFNGIPILISPEIEPDKLLLIPEQNAARLPYWEQYLGRNSYYVADPWAPWEPISPNDFKRKIKQLTKTPVDEPEVDIDEDSFISILKGE